MENHNAIRKQIEAAQKALNSAIRLLDAVKVIEDKQHYVETCRYCRKPIAMGANLTRGIHDHCYQDANSLLVKPGIKTWEQLEAEGVVGPPGKPGRPRRNPELAREIKDRIRRSNEKSD